MVAISGHHEEIIGKAVEKHEDLSHGLADLGLGIFLLDPGQDPVEATAFVRGDQSYEDFTRTTFVGTSDQIASHIHQRVELGLDYFILYFPRVAYDHTMLRRFAAEVMPRFNA